MILGCKLRPVNAKREQEQGFFLLLLSFAAANCCTLERLQVTIALAPLCYAPLGSPVGLAFFKQPQHNRRAPEVQDRWSENRPKCVRSINSQRCPQKKAAANWRGPIS
jgi:hypothetical protein